MAVRRTSGTPLETTRLPPATTPEGRENQLVSLAMDLVEKRMREGTASAQETTHFLKLGSSRESLEQERLRHENKLTEAKIEDIRMRGNVEELYKDALAAMSAYKGEKPPESFDEYDD